MALLGVVIALPVLAGGWLWLRNSSFVSVQRVQVTGVHGPEARAIEAALVTAGRRMSTLDVHTASLRDAVASFAVVREVRAVPSFPHGLRIEVIEQPPVAALLVGGARTAVAADGVVLGPALLSGSLPTVNGDFEPAAGQRVRGWFLLGAVSVLGAAPAPLARLVARVFTGPDGLTVAMRNGLLAYFGDATRPHAKWLSLARVLADPSSAGASYVDVRLPSRPAAGFPGGVAPAGASASAAGAASAEQPGSSESTVAALATSLTAASGGGASSAPASAPPSAGPSTAAALESASSQQPAQSTSAPSTEAAPGTPAPGG